MSCAGSAAEPKPLCLLECIPLCSDCTPTKARINTFKRQMTQCVFGHCTPSGQLSLAMHIFLYFFDILGVRRVQLQVRSDLIRWCPSDPCPPTAEEEEYDTNGSSFVQFLEGIFRSAMRGSAKGLHADNFARGLGPNPVQAAVCALTAPTPAVCWHDRARHSGNGCRCVRALSCLSHVVIGAGAGEFECWAFAARLVLFPVFPRRECCPFTSAVTASPYKARPLAVDGGGLCGVADACAIEAPPPGT